MPKVEIDEIDQKIVDALIADGRASAAEIARTLGGISERVVRYRMERLIREGVVKIGAIVNPVMLGYSVMADVFLEVESGGIEQVARQVLAYDCVTYVAFSIGESDVSLQIVGRSNEQIYTFVTEVLGKLPKVRRTVTSIVPVKLKDVYEWRIPDQSVTRR
ncbi:MAG: Lrp/AsnC family transcriptional regulator [Anaerolineales bacterium]|jgi:Lrp/AsnC family transcriptional regulator for asnA, asnC and gidA|nr:Lrp/AsnC family transcriptional regulator [Anaerolineales bacterium]